MRRKHREVPVILLFPRLHPERAKEALRLGAMAVLKYPVPAAELRAAVLAGARAVRGPGSRDRLSAPASSPSVRRDAARFRARTVGDAGPWSGHRGSRRVLALPSSSTDRADRSGGSGATPSGDARHSAVDSSCPRDRPGRQRSELAPGHRAGRHDRRHPDPRS